MTGHAIADVSHLLAELLENAAAFSPPSAPVVVAGRRVDRRFVITITDEGIGMSDDRLAAANALLARPPAPGLSLSRTLGLYVVAHLAARHGIHVQLRHAPGTGLTAVVALPTDVLARVEDAPLPQPPRVEPASAPAPPMTYVAEPVDAEPLVAHSTTAAVVDPFDVPHRPVPAGTWAEARVDDMPLPRRAPSTTAPGGNGGAHAEADQVARHLTPRTPGANLSQSPVDRAASGATAARPRPERVAELLSRHERGKREGQARGPGDDR